MVAAPEIGANNTVTFEVLTFNIDEVRTCGGRVLLHVDIIVVCNLAHSREATTVPYGNCDGHYKILCGYVSSHCYRWREEVSSQKMSPELSLTMYVPFL